jgi:hypothetical protein
MRSIYYVAGITALLAAGPAFGQVIFQAPNPDSGWHEQRAQQQREHARWANSEAQRRAAMGDYEGAAEAQREARHDWRNAQREEHRWQDERGPSIQFGPR